MTEDILGISSEVLVVGLTYILGAYISTAIWVYKKNICPVWMFLTTIICWDPKFAKKLFIDGPGLLIIIIWLIVGCICGFVLTPLLIH